MTAQPKPDMHLFQVPRSALCIFSQVLEEYALHTLPDMPSGAVVIDLGANNGAFTWHSLGRWPGCKVIAYEPHPGTCNRLRSNLQGLAVEVHEQAVVHPKTSATAKLFEGLNADTECSLRDDVRWPHVSQDLSRSVAVTLHDSAELPPCEVLKVDTEGSEVGILSGYRFLKDVEVLLVEAHAVGGDLQGQLDQIVQLALTAGLAFVDIRGTTVRFVRDPGALKMPAAGAAVGAGQKTLATLPEGDWFEIETVGGSPRLGRLNPTPVPPLPKQGGHEYRTQLYFEPCYKMSHQRFFVPLPSPGQAPVIRPIDLPFPLVWGDSSGEYVAVSAMRPITLERAREIVGAQATSA